MDVVVDSVTQVWGEEPTSVVALDRFSHHFRAGCFSCLMCRYNARLDIA